jgi:hypothetical protein
MPVEVFGGSATQVAYPSISFLDITLNSITLVWPTSYFNVPSVVDGIHYDVLAASIYVTDGMGNANTITLPDATESSNGASFYITNIGMSSFQLLLSDSSELVVIPNSPNTANSFWVQLTDNSTSAGTWRFVQFGAGTSSAVASTLAGNGLVALSGLLNTNVVVKSISITPYSIITSDRAKLLLWQTGAGAINLPAIAAVPAGFYISLNNEGTGIVTVTGDATIDNNATISVSPGQSLSIISDGTKWWTLGFGQNLASANFDAGSATNPSITFTGHTTTGIYYYQTSFPPVTPPGIGFSVGAAPIANISASGLFMNAGNTIIAQDITEVAQTTLSSNSSYGQLSWQDNSLTNPATLNISGTNTDTILTLGPFAGFSISESNSSSSITFSDNEIWEIGSDGSSVFSFPVTFQNAATFHGTISLSTPLSIANGGTGHGTQQTALNAIMPASPAIGDLLYFDGTNWVSLHVSPHAAGAVLTLVGSPPIPTWVP